MRHFFALIAIVSLAGFGTIGCQKEAETTRKVTVTSPTGTTTTTDKHTVESSGSNPPANAQGEVAK